MRFYIFLVIFWFCGVVFVPSVFAGGLLNAAKNFAGNLAGNVIPRDPCSINGPGAKCVSPQAALECIKYRKQSLYAKMQQKGTVFIYTGEQSPLARYVTENPGNGRQILVAFSLGTDNNLNLLEGFAHNDPSCLAQLNAKKVTFRNTNVTVDNIQPIAFESESSLQALQLFNGLIDVGQQELIAQQNTPKNIDMGFNSNITPVGLNAGGGIRNSNLRTPNSSAGSSLQTINTPFASQNGVDWRQNIRGLSIDELEPLLSPQQISELLKRRSIAPSSTSSNGSSSATLPSSPSVGSFGFGNVTSMPGGTSASTRTASTSSSSPLAQPTMSVSGGSLGLSGLKDFVSNVPNNFNAQSSMQNIGSVAGSMGLPTQSLQPSQSSNSGSSIPSIASGFGFNLK